MERSTGKTMDCYAEFLTPADAEVTFKRISLQQESGRLPRLGNRHITVELSSQDALLRDLFPCAKCVAWEAGWPRLIPNTDPYCSGFQGFLTNEELLGIVRHAENSHRVCPLNLQCETALISHSSHHLLGDRRSGPTSA
jgi:hypothetical protein